jgi:hypothetical protein
MESRMVMFQNMVHSPAPSSWAFSYSSRERIEKAFQQKDGISVGQPRRIRAAKVFNSFKSRNIRNTGICVTMGGKPWSA